METSNTLPEENKDTLKDEHWEEGSDEEEEEQKTKVVAQPKRPLLKDKNGEIIINKLDTYIEPTKAVKEARGDTRMANRYNFGELSFDEDEEEEEEETSQHEESAEETKKKKNKSVKKTQAEDLDDLLKEFGVEAKTEAPKVKEPKPKKVKTEETVEKEPKPEGEAEVKKKKKKAAAKPKAASSHVNDLKREILERKEALKKKEKKKGI